MHDVGMEDKKFAYILRMYKNSLYLLFGISIESNTTSLPCFGCSIKAIQLFLQKILYTFFSHGSELGYIVT
jgi:hypothetical protein